MIKRDWVWPALTIILFGFVLTLPLANYFDAAVYGIPHDNYYTFWLQWALHKALWEGMAFRDFNYVYYPLGYDLLDGMPMFTSWGFIGFWAALVKNPFLSFNLNYFSQWWLSAFCMFLLGRRIVGSTWLAVVMGVVWAYSPYLSFITKAYGPNFFGAFFPLLILSIVDFMAKPTKKALGLLLLAGFFAAGHNFYYTYFFFVLLVAAAFYGSILWCWPQIGKYIPVFEDITDSITRYKSRLVAKRLQWYGILSLVGVVLLVYFARRWAIGDVHVRPVEEAVIRTPTPLFYFIPALDNYFWGKYLEDFYWARKGPLDTFEMALYLGVTPVLLFSCGFIFSRKLSKAQRVWLTASLVLMLTSMLMAVGPEFAPGVKAPGYFVFEFAPMFRHMGRFQLFTTLFLTIGAGIGFQSLWKLSNKNYRRVLLAGLVLSGLLLDYGNFGTNNLSYLKRTTPKAYKYLATLPEPFPILEWPASWWRYFSNYMAMQPLHGKKLANTTNFRSSLNVLLPEDQRRARELGFRYLVVNKKMPPMTLYPYSPRAVDMGDRFFADRDYFGYLRRVATWDDSTLYELSSDFDPSGWFFKYGTGFDLGSDHTSSLKWTVLKTSTIFVYNHVSTPRRLRLHFKAETLATYHFEVSYNHKRVPLKLRGTQITNLEKLKPTTQRLVTSMIRIVKTYREGL